MIAQAEIPIVLLKGGVLNRERGGPSSKNARRKMERYGHVPLVLRNAGAGLDVPEQFFSEQVWDTKKLIYKKPYWKRIQRGKDND